MPKTILILHGWNSSRKSWAQVESLLSKDGCKVVIPDMPGFGETPPPPRPWTSDDYLNWVLEFTKNLKLKTPLVLVGHSFGGGLAMKLAIANPELVEKLILVASARIKHKQTLYKKLVGILAKTGKVFSRITIIKKLFYKFVVRETDYLRTSGVMRDTFRNIINEDLTSQIGKIEKPTFIVWGSRDKATPVSDAYVINQKIKGSRLEIIKGCGHALNLECPEKLASKISEFINS